MWQFFSHFSSSYSLLWCVVNSFWEKKLESIIFFVSQGKRLDNSVIQLMYKLHISAS